MGHTPLLRQPDAPSVSNEQLSLTAAYHGMQAHICFHARHSHGLSRPADSHPTPSAPVTRCPAVASGLLTAPHALALTPHTEQSSTHGTSRRSAGHSYVHS
jgi:hypothetical protein